VSAVSYLKSVDRVYNMEGLYKIIGKSRQHYAQAVNRQLQTNVRDKAILDTVRQWRVKHPKMGSRVLYHSIKEAGIDLGIGINKFEHILSKHGLLVRIHKGWPKTSDGKGKESYENLTNGLQINNINQLVVADITYIMVGLSWHYLFTLKDAYSQRLISLVPSTDMTVKNALNCLKDLIKLRGQPALIGCIHHTDNGSQYNAKIYKKQLAKLQMTISRSSSCQENGSAEQLNFILKNMYLNNYGISNMLQLKRACKEVVYLMNMERSIEQLNHLTVAKFEREILDMPSDQRPVKRLYDFTQT